jgi:hypothetical protein
MAIPESMHPHSMAQRHEPRAFALALSDDRAFGRERRTQTASRVRRFLMSINAAL